MLSQQGEEDSNQIPTSLTYLASDRDKLSKLQNKLSIKKKSSCNGNFWL